MGRNKQSAHVILIERSGMMSERIGFYDLRPTLDDKGFMGAMLVTDELGKPEEFRVTYPVKPSNLQRQLYGQSLLPHIGVELCGKPLFQSLRSKPEIVVLRDPLFLDLAQYVNTQVVCLERMAEKLVISADGDDKSERKATITSPSARFEPVSVTYPDSYDDDQRNALQATILRFFRGFDVVEPFDRIVVAIKMLSEQDEKFR